MCDPSFTSDSTLSQYSPEAFSAFYLGISFVFLAVSLISNTTFYPTK